MGSSARPTTVNTSLLKRMNAAVLTLRMSLFDSRGLMRPRILSRKSRDACTNQNAPMQVENAHV